MRFAWFVLSAILALDQSAPQRDRSTPPPGTGTVRGRIVSATTGNPLHRVQVTLSGGAQTPRPAVTDTKGEFEIANVSPGTYTATARRLGYLTTQYGQRPGGRG